MLRLEAENMPQLLRRLADAFDGKTDGLLPLPDMTPYQRSIIVFCKFDLHRLCHTALVMLPTEYEALQMLTPAEFKVYQEHLAKLLEESNASRPG